MKAILLALAFVFAGATSAAASHVYFRPPAYDEAIYGTPNEPKSWVAGPILRISSLEYRSNLSDAQVLAFAIANAVPGGIVDWYGQQLGVVADNGTFSTTSPILLGRDGYDRQYVGRIRVFLPYNAYNEFDVVRLEVSGFAPSASPEPSSWALMIVGLGMVGSVARRRSVIGGQH